MIVTRSDPCASSEQGFRGPHLRGQFAGEVFWGLTTFDQ